MNAGKYTLRGLTEADVRDHHGKGIKLNIAGCHWAPVLLLKEEVMPRNPKPKPDGSIHYLNAPSQILEAWRLGLDVYHRPDAGSIWLGVTSKDVTAEQLMADIFCYMLKVEPKTMVINGVEVPAPVKDGCWFVKFHLQTVDKASHALANRLYWATKEDAEAVLAAILKPFKEFGYA